MHRTDQTRIIALKVALFVLLKGEVQNTKLVREKRGMGGSRRREPWEREGKDDCTYQTQLLMHLLSAYSVLTFHSALTRDTHSPCHYAIPLCH